MMEGGGGVTRGVKCHPGYLAPPGGRELGRNTVTQKERQRGRGQ